MRGTKGTLFILLSVALHVVWAFSAPRSQPRQAAETRANEVKFTMAEPAKTEEPPAPTVQPPEPPPEPVVVRPTRPKERERTRPAPAEPTLSIASIEPVQPATVAEPAAPEVPAVETPAAPSGKGIDISPRAAALAFVPSQQPADDALRCSPERRLPSGESCVPNDAEGKAQAELTRNMRAIAQSAPHLKKRDKPQLQPRSDGTYDYSGHVFNARIGKDGQVSFGDDAASASLQASLTPLRVVMDINDLAEAAQKKELYTAEKRWFLEQTTELRNKLADAFRIEEAARTRRALEQELERILAAHDRNPTQKRADVFAVWQDCGEDGHAVQVRRIVEAFVQRRMPQDSELGFSVAELERLNKSRAGLRAFQPYRAAAAGGAPG